MPRILARALRALLYTLATLVIVWFALIEAPMFYTRWRMSQLLADFHSIQLNQSNWRDAQRLMARWGKYGHYDGTCTTTDCTYDAFIDDPYSHWMSKVPERWSEHIYNSHFPSIFVRLGWRMSFFHLQFTVQDGRIVRTSTSLVIAADSGTPDHFSYALGIQTQVRPRLVQIDSNADDDKPWILGRDEQLDDHPDYKVGRPSGCEGCENVEVTYTAHLSHQEIVRLTNFNLSCLTRFRSCAETGDLLPAGRDWNLYQEDKASSLRPSGPDPISCRIDARARGRDAEVILEVEPLSITSQIDTEYPRDTYVPATFERVDVRVLRVLKGNPHIPEGKLAVIPFRGTLGFPGYLPETPLTISSVPNSKLPEYEPPQLSEHLTPGHRSILAFNKFESELQRCGVFDDTPAILAALQIGIAEDIPYRRPVYFGWWR